MNYTLILTEQPIIISDEPIKEGDSYLYNVDKISIATKEDELLLKYCKKILYGLPHQPTIDFSLVQQWAEEHGIVDVEKLANEEYELQERAFENSTEMFPHNDSLLLKAGFIDGFNTHKYLSGKRYSEEDVRNAIDIARTRGKHPNEEFNNTDTNLIIQQLSRKSFNVKLEMQTINQDYRFEVGQITQPKITNKAVKITKICG